MKDETVSTLHSQELGKLQNTFFPRPAPGQVLLGSAIACVVFSVLEVIAAINKYLKPPSTILSDKYRQDSIMIAAILSVVIFIIALSLAALYNAHRKHRVDLYDNGVVVSTWRGQTTVLWGDLMKVEKLPIYGHSTRPVNWNYTLYKFDGAKVEIRGLEGLGVLGRILEKQDES